MNKNFKVIQLNGLSGLLLLGVVIAGLVCGFVLFPIWMIAVGWNAVIAQSFNGPDINYIQAALLWSIIAISLLMGLKNSVSFRVQKENDLNDVDLKKVVKSIETSKEPTEKEEQEGLVK